MEKNREDVEHFVDILKRDEEIEQVSLGGGRRSTASSAVSKLSEAEHHHEKSVHYDAYVSPQVIEGEQHHHHEHVHQNSDDSFDKVENHHIEDKSIHYEAYSSEVHSDEQHHQQEHSDDSSDKNLTIIRREVQYDPYSSEIVENDDDPHHHHDHHIHQRESSNDSGEEKDNISVVEKVVHHDDHHQHQYSDDSSEKKNFHVVEKMVQYDPYSSEVLVDAPPHRNSSSDGSVSVHEKHQQSHDGYELPRSKQQPQPQHYSTFERTPTDINRYDNPPASEERYIHNIQVGQSFKSAKVENDDYLILKARDATVTQHPAPAAPKQVQEVHHQKAVEQAASSPKSKKEKNPYMAFDMSSDAANPLIEKSYDLDDRDTHDNVQYLNTNFFEIFAEPSPQYHSVACVWTLSFKIFEIVRVYSYKILTLIFGLLIAILAGFFFALFAFLNIWIVRPLLYLARVALSQIITIWPMALIYIVRPFFYSVGAVFSTARLHTSSGSQVPEIWEKHVHVV